MRLLREEYLSFDRYLSSLILYLSKLRYSSLSDLILYLSKLRYSSLSEGGLP
jgi:hypothetical protein